MFRTPVVCEEHGYMRAITISSPGLNAIKFVGFCLIV